MMAARTDGWKRLDETPMAVAAGKADETEPALASDGAGGLVCVYEKEHKGRIAICARALTTK